MDNARTRLFQCFKTVFPDLDDSQIPTASQASLEAWDSVATVMLANVVAEEFSIPVDFERLAEMDSFNALEAWVAPGIGKS